MQLSATGVFKCVWPFIGHQALKSYDLHFLEQFHHNERFAKYFSKALGEGVWYRVHNCERVLKYTCLNAKGKGGVKITEKLMHGVFEWSLNKSKLLQMLCLCQPLEAKIWVFFLNMKNLGKFVQ